MICYLGFDGGGTKTECTLMDATGKLLAQGLGGPSNPVRAGFEKAFVALDEAANAALSAAQVDARQVHGVCAGLAGAGRSRVVKRVMGHLVEAFPEADVHVTTDYDIALETAVGLGAGVVLIAGTGSVAFGRNASGRTIRAGGLGPWIGDDGSAFDIGRAAVKAVAQARDGLEPVTLLSELIPNALQCPTWEGLTERIAESPDEIFPIIFPLVLEAAEDDDAPARDILMRAAFALSRIAASVIRRLGMANAEFVLAKSGGVFGHSQFFESALDALLSSLAPRARIALLTEHPSFGAASMARRLFPISQAEAVHGGKG
jgi:N-acetylglucosamine kinase